MRGWSFRSTTPSSPTCTITTSSKVRKSTAQWAGLRIEALNHALQGIPEDRVRYHVCFGSWHVPHLADAPLEEIVGFILSVRAGAYSIEAANPRHEHEWRVWEGKRLPAGKILIPGVVTHHTITVEHPRLVADRILRFARLVGRENVIAGTDCGFAQAQFIQRAAAVRDVGEIRGAGGGGTPRQCGALGQRQDCLTFVVVWKPNLLSIRLIDTKGKR